jgi:hypothetical protein
LHFNVLGPAPLSAPLALGSFLMSCELKYEIQTTEPGVLTYRQGGTEFRFPVYNEDGETVFVAWPTSKRIFLYFAFGGWTLVPKEFSKRDHDRITAHVIEHFQREGARVRVLERPEADEQGLQFHPELFECKGRASELLDTAGLVWLSDYSSIDLLHEEFGLEVCGIHEDSNVELIVRAMRSGFPHWHYSHACFKDGGREPGWKFTLHMFPRRCGGGRCIDAD